MRGHQYVDRPPDMSNVAPVENEQSSLHSHAIKAATSVTLPSRPIGILPMENCCCSGFKRENSGLSIAAGQTQFTRMPVVASSLPRLLVNPMMPAFAAA